jgi:hypothetical protein
MAETILLLVAIFVLGFILGWNLFHLRHWLLLRRMQKAQERGRLRQGVMSIPLGEVKAHKIIHAVSLQARSVTVRSFAMAAGRELKK